MNYRVLSYPENLKLHTLMEKNSEHMTLCLRILRCLFFLSHYFPRVFCFTNFHPSRILVSNFAYL